MGDIIRRPKLAKTLRSIANFGVDEFYEGSVGQNLVNDIQNAGGVLTMEDLRNYQ